MGPLYPGDDYVDWVGLTAYVDETTALHAKLFLATTAQFDQVAPSKPST